jgi:cytochrome c oxidase accessory protein FixG
VCPTGIDIRDGQQLECINCGLCIDACNRVMDGVGLPRGLIALDTLSNVEARKKGGESKFHLIRGRTIVYGSVMILVGGIMLFGLISRSPLDINVLRDRNPLFVTLSDGGIRNGYTFKIINKLHDSRTYALSVMGLQQPEISVAGRTDADTTFTVAPDQLASYRIFLKVDRKSLEEEATDIEFVLTDSESGTTATYDSVFRGPAR